MKIYVTVKQVPDTSGRVAVKPDGTLDRASMQTITNPDDRHALEAALQLKDKLHCRVTVVTMGPPAAKDMLCELMAMGADEAVLISGREFSGSDTYATSQILAAAIDMCGVGPEDLILAGRQAIDGDTAQVGPQLAEKLHMPHVSCAGGIEYHDGVLTVKQMLEDGYRIVKVHTPCLVTCVKTLNTPRYMTVGGIMEAYRMPLKVIDYDALKDHPLIRPESIGLAGSPTNIYKSFTPPQKKSGTLLTGTAEEAADALAALLDGMNII